MPQSLMRRDEAFERLAPVMFGRHATPREHDFQRFQKLVGDDQVLRVAGVMEGDQNLVRQAAALPWDAASAGFGWADIRFSQLVIDEAQINLAAGSDPLYLLLPKDVSRVFCIKTDFSCR